ncbi:MAG: RluA family pseudouridine synthase [Chloroflexota bacterium]
MQTHRLTSDRAGERLDAFLARRLPEISRTHLRRLIDSGHVTIEGRMPKAAEKMRDGVVVDVVVPPPEDLSLEAQDIPLTIVYQDNDLLVIDKPPGLTMHPAPGHPNGTLVNALLAACPDLQGISGTLRPGIVHRLDKDTSGLLVVAKNDRAMQALQAQLMDRSVHKTYAALVVGTPKPAEGQIEAPIGRSPRNRKKMAVVDGGRESTTRYKLREELPGYALLDVEPVTGRTHQIRVHLSAIGHPVFADAMYGKPSPVLGRQFLHAWKLAFRMPLSERQVEFESPLPADLRAALERLRDV